MRTTQGRIADLEKRILALRGELAQRRNKPRLVECEDHAEAMRLAQQLKGTGPLLVVSRVSTDPEE